MDGHASCVGGAIVDSGNFDWDVYPDKFLTYHAGRDLSWNRVYEEIWQRRIHYKRQPPADAGLRLHPGAAECVSSGISALDAVMRDAEARECLERGRSICRDMKR